VAGEAPTVPGGELARVQRERRDLALADAHLDAAPDKPGIKRLVTGIHAHVGIRRHTQDDPLIEIRERGR